MKNQHRKTLHLTIFCCVLLLIGSALMLRVTVSANKDESKTEAADRSLNLTSEPQNERVRQIIQSSAFGEFDVWVEQYQKGNFRAADEEQIKRGEILAAERRELLKELIRLDPQAAIEKAIPVDIYTGLPSVVTDNSEKRISAHGDFLVYVFDEVDHATGKMTGSRIAREVVFGDSRYKAVVYGRREAMTTKMNIPLQGIIIDDTMLIDESPVQEIKSADFAATAVDRSKLGENGAVAQVGGEIKYFPSRSELNDFVNEQIEWESKIGPERPKEKLAPNENASTWTEGPKTVLLIRVDFPDKPGEPTDTFNGQTLTVPFAQNLFNNVVNPFFIDNSYNKTSLQATVTPVVRLPQPTTFYTQGTNYNALLTDARNAARTAGFETNNYNLDIAAFSTLTGFNWAGLGFPGGKGAWLNGYFVRGTTSHELGHNYGLNHANLWRTTDGTTIGQGNNVEYDDVFDVMGRSGNFQHFNASYKRQLDWLTEASVQTVTSDGVYRVFAQDTADSSGVRLLRIKKDSTKNYEVEFRQRITANPNAMNGALVRWYYPQMKVTQLLDMTSNTITSPTGINDAPLLVGQSFFDDVNRARITVLGKGSTTPESLDIRVELNIGCSFSLAQTTQNFAATGGESSVTVNIQSGCNSYSTSNDDWISIVNTGIDTVGYIVAANYSSQPRTGTLNIGGQILTVQQGVAITVCATQPSGLAAWWRAEGNALDQTGVNNGSIQTGMTFSAGKIGGGFKGGGTSSNRIFVPDSPSLALDRSLSIEGWLRYETAGNYVILVRGDERDYNGSYVIYLFDGRVSFGIRGAPNAGNATVSSSPLTTNQFSHFAATLDDATGQMKLYINGSVVSQRTTSIRPYRDLDTTKNPRIAIGNLAHSSLGYNSFKGVIDELAIYNRGLSEAEIQAIYNAGTAATGAAGKCLSVTKSRKRARVF